MPKEKQIFNDDIFNKIKTKLLNIVSMQIEMMYRLALAKNIRV